MLFSKNIMYKLCIFLVLFIFAAFEAKAQEMRTIIDMRGKEVTFKKDLQRIATISDGFVESIMTNLGVIDKVVAIGSWGLKRDYSYNFTTKSGEKRIYAGLSTIKFLHPWLNELQCFNSPQGNILNFETLANVNPELIILRVGDCTVNGANKELVAKTINIIEALGFPLVVIYAPSYFQKDDLSTLENEMAVIGDIFAQKDKAIQLAKYLAATEALIKERTSKIKEAEKTSVLYLGLNPNVRKQGAAGSVFGINTPESYIIENVVNAKNAFAKNGYRISLSAEQIYALEPDVIILPTLNGYHPPLELYEAEYFKNLSELAAIKNKRIYSMPWTPMNCSQRIEYPLDMLIMAKAAYPDLFSDINIYEFALQFYQDIYNVDLEVAKGLRSTQLLDWMKEYDF